MFHEWKEHILLQPAFVDWLHGAGNWDQITGLSGTKY